MAPGPPDLSAAVEYLGSNTGPARLSLDRVQPGTYPVAATRSISRANGGGGGRWQSPPRPRPLTLAGDHRDIYTYNVVAVDARTTRPCPSRPVTFTVPPPKHSCAVR